MRESPKPAARSIESPAAALWRKAAVLGSLWASFEIVLGSFLHNAQFPLAGHVLTGIGTALLVAGHRLWPERGLLWRAGLVCAAMKSISPSAFLLGPMIAISMEGLLLEAGVLAVGANPIGYLLGGGLAMSWPLFHRIGSLLLFYGPDAVALYARGWEAMGGWLGRPGLGPWIPLYVLWAAHFMAGCLAAAAGFRVARPASDVAPARRLPGAAGRTSGQADVGSESRSLILLGFHLCLIVGAMFWARRLPFWALLAATAAYSAYCALFYQRALEPLRRPGLWAGLLLVSTLAGLLLGQSLLGIQMGARALILTLGFAAVGEELRNPTLRAWLERLGAGLFLRTVEAAFETLPEVLAGLPDGREIARSPMGSLRAVLVQAPDRLHALEEGRDCAARVHILTGPTGAGKSDLLRLLVQELRRSGASVGGIRAPGLWAEGGRLGFDVADLLTGEERPLCRTQGPDGWRPLGPFRFSPDGVGFGLRALAAARRRDVDLLVVDEVGPLELQGGGWAPELDALARERRKPMVWVVREQILEAVKERWRLSSTRTWKAGRTDAKEMASALRQEAGGLLPNPAGRPGAYATRL